MFSTANICIVGSIICYGVGTFIGKVALRNSSSINIYLLEALGTLTIAALVAIYFRNEAQSIVSSFNGYGYLFGILYGIGTVLFVVALKQQQASVATSLMAVYPAITVVLSVIFLKEIITFKILLGVAMVMTGTSLLLSSSSV